MELAFKELIREQQSFSSVIFSGSAGIGKSVLLFLIVLYRVWKNDEKAIYFRTVTNVVMGAWTRASIETAVITLGVLDPDEDVEQSEKYFDPELFDEIYYVNGGRIRGFVEGYQQGIPQKKFADETIDRISKVQAQLSLSHSDCRSTDDHVGFLRSMFRTDAGATTDSVNLHVDSQYMLRGLEDKVDLEEICSSYKKAEKDGNKGAQANYFEEMLHLVFSRVDTFAEIDSFVRAQGSGVEGVKELEQKNQYWIPSVPNFVNIDSALVDANGVIWCFQYTIRETHSYKQRRLKSKFLDNIAIEGCTDGLELVFVVPLGTKFTEPDTGNEASTSVQYIDCSSLEAVITSAQHVLTGVAKGRKRTNDSA